MKGFEAVRPNPQVRSPIPQLLVSAVADNPTTIALPRNGPPPPQGADILAPYNSVAFVYTLCRHIVYKPGIRFIVHSSSFVVMDGDGWLCGPEEVAGWLYSLREVAR